MAEENGDDDIDNDDDDDDIDNDDDDNDDNDDDGKDDDDGHLWIIKNVSGESLSPRPKTLPTVRIE